MATATEVVLEVKGGEGGDDSKLFAQDLFSAYLKYARSHSMKCELLSSGYGQYSCKIMGSGVWQLFKSEVGKHCVQRIPPTERGGRRQTSYLTVGVLPVLTKGVTLIPESDIEVKTQGGHGKGGQHQNTTDSAVRMKHKPTGLHVFINGRSQFSNRREARRILSAKVQDFYRMRDDAAYASIRKGQMGDAGRGSKIRTYNLIKGRIVDHRTGKKTKNVKRVVERGDFDLLK